MHKLLSLSSFALASRENSESNSTNMLPSNEGSPEHNKYGKKVPSSSFFLKSPGKLLSPTSAQQGGRDFSQIEDIAFSDQSLPYTTQTEGFSQKSSVISKPYNIIETKSSREISMLPHSPKNVSQPLLDDNKSKFQLEKVILTPVNSAQKDQQKKVQKPPQDVSKLSIKEILLMKHDSTNLLAQKIAKITATQSIPNIDQSSEDFENLLSDKDRVPTDPTLGSRYRRRSCICTWCGGTSSLEIMTHNHPGLPATLALQRSILGSDAQLDHPRMKKDDMMRLKRKSSVRVSLLAKNAGLSRKGSFQEGSFLLERNRLSSFYKRGSFIANNIFEEIGLKAEEEEQREVKVTAEDIQTTNQLQKKDISDTESEDSSLNSSVKLEKKPKRVVKRNLTRASTYHNGRDLKTSLVEFKALEMHQKSYHLKNYEEALVTKGPDITSFKIKKKKTVKKYASKGTLTATASVQKIYGLSTNSSISNLHGLVSPSSNTGLSPKKIELSPVSPKSPSISFSAALHRIVTVDSSELEAKRLQRKTSGRKKLFTWNQGDFMNLTELESPVSPEIPMSPKSPKKNGVDICVTKKVNLSTVLHRIVTTDSSEMEAKRSQWKASGRKYLSTWNQSDFTELESPSSPKSLMSPKSPKKSGVDLCVTKNKKLKVLASPKAKLNAQREWLMRTYSTASAKEMC